MEVGDFIINGVESKELKTKIQNRPVLQIPQRKTQENDEIPLRSGSLLFDDSGYRNTIMELSMYVVGNSFEESSLNRNELVSLFHQGEYNQFVPYFDKDKIYYVRVTGGFFNGSRPYGHVQPVGVTLSVAPFKRLIGFPNQTVSNGSTITNPTPFNAHPKITIVGSGNINLSINGKVVQMQAVENQIILDSDAMVAYRDVSGTIHSMNHKMLTLDFPVLKSGTNSISWTGTVTNVSIESRWQVLT